MEDEPCDREIEAGVRHQRGLERVFVRRVGLGEPRILASELRASPRV